MWYSEATGGDWQIDGYIYIYDIGERSVYVQCISGEVDEVKHILLKCSSVGSEIEREMLVKQIQHYENLNVLSNSLLIKS